MAEKLQCVRNGCNSYYTEEDNVDGSCRYHEADGLRKWICCKKSTLLNIPGCKTGKHTTEKPMKGKAIAAPNQARVEDPAAPKPTTNSVANVSPPATNGSIMFSRKQMLAELIGGIRGVSCRRMYRFPPAFSTMLLQGFTKETVMECDNAVYDVVKEAKDRILKNLNGKRYVEKITYLDELITYMTGYTEETRKIHRFLEEKHKAFITALEEQNPQALQHTDYLLYIEKHDRVSIDICSHIERIKLKTKTMSKGTSKFLKYEEHAADLLWMITNLEKAFLNFDIGCCFLMDKNTD